MNIIFEWNITWYFVLSQVVTLISYIFAGMTFVTKKRNKILLFNILAIIFGATALILLGAWTGVLMSGIALFRSVAFIINDAVQERKRGNAASAVKKPSDKITIFDTIVFVLVVIGSVIVSIFIWEGIIGLFSIFGTVIFSFAIYQKNIKRYRIFGAIGVAHWVVYLIFIGSPVGALLETLLLGVSLASIAFYGIIEKITKENVISVAVAVVEEPGVEITK